METISALLALIAGLLVRLAIPILLTALLIFLLRNLDARWQKQAQAAELVVLKPECWKIKGCPPDQVKDCLGAQSRLPCWQAFRLPNGYLREACLTCKVFTETPAPKLQIEPRRM
jgi:hypothetical protein